MTVVNLEFGAAKPYPKQRPLLDSEGVVVCCGATKTGKTKITASWILRRWLEFAEGSMLPSGYVADGRNAWYAPTYRVSKISYDRLVVPLRPLIAQKLVVATTSPFPLIRGVGPLAGRELHFRSAEDPSSIYGDHWDAVVVEEFTRMRSGSIDAIMTTMLPKRAPGRFIGNKVNKHNDGHKLASLVESGDGRPGWSYLDLTCYDARDAGLVTDEELAAIRTDYVRRGAAHIFARDYENRFDDAGQPFPADLVASCVRELTQEELRCAASFALLIDAGGTENPAGIVVVRSWQHEGAARAHVVMGDHFVGTLPKLEQRIGSVVEQFGPSAITFDSYAPMLGQTIEAKHPRQAKKVSSRAPVLQAGYETIRGMMDGGTLTIDPSCIDLIRDLDYVTHANIGVDFAYYERRFEETDRDHQVHADCANAMIQGWSAAIGGTTMQQGAGQFAVEGGEPIKTFENRRHVNTRTDWR